jgi:hypothetical protein
VVLETTAFVLIGLAVGFGALELLPEYFPQTRALTLSTALVSALLSGGVGQYALADRLPGLALVISAIGSALLLSVLAHPKPPGRHRGAHRRV